MMEKWGEMWKIYGKIARLNQIIWKKPMNIHDIFANLN